jgi:signal transduction histidine kinase/CheY-like chemotaxis protein/HPt (histidine-containing phosphotransfer) domain-containing protein
VDAADRGRARVRSLRRELAVLLAVVGVLAAALFIVTTFQSRAAGRQTEAENRRTESFLLADKLRQSSNDLTTMVRLYVSTGDSRFRDYYDEILAIRGGTAPRPRDYGSSFWNRVLAEGKGFVRYGPPESLTAQMRAARFTAAEFDALDASLRASNRLATLEVEVMDRVAGRVRAGVDETYLADVGEDYERLVDPAYMADKGVIMAAIDDFIALVERRTLRDVERARADVRRLSLAQIAILVALALVGGAAVLMLRRTALRPLEQLTAVTRRIAAGDYAERAHVRAVSELEQVAGAFNEMAEAIETDVAGRQRAEQEALDASRSKSTFLAAMSHEIRTPMIGVTGMLEVLAKTELTAQQRHMVGTAQSSAQSLLQIIGDILDFSKIEAGRLEINPTTFALRPLTEAAVDTFLHTASTKGLLLDWTADERLAETHVGDPLRIRQIIANFLSNAVKFTEVGGIEVTLRVLEESAEAQTVEVAVTDTGVGVPVEHQKRLFAEFAQAEAGTAQQFGGTGLGLVICKRLAVLMGGDVTLESAPGVGTTVRLTLPMPIGDAAALEASPELLPGALPATRAKPSRVQAEREGSVLLLAEDHPVNRTVLTHQFDVAGFHVDTAVDGQDAYERYLGGGYALVFTDLNMPRMDGYELARAIRRHEEQTGLERTPIVALTANVMQGEPAKCAEAGMDDFAAKPATIPVLASKLHRWLPTLEWPALEPPSRPPASASGPVLDEAVLDDLTGSDPAFAASLLADFVEASRGDLRALSVALAARDHAGVRQQAHRIVGAGRMVGATELVAVASRLESAARAESCDWGELATLVEHLDELLARIAAAAPS